MKFILFFLASSLLFSCNKGKAEITLKGTINDITFGTTHSGASVKLYENIAGGSSINLLGTSTIGSNGSYSFTFPRNKAESYTLIIQKNLYFEINELIYLSSLTIEDDNVRNYSTTAKSWAKLHFVSPSSQYMTYTKQSGKQNCTECCPSEEQSLSGIMDTNIYCINDGNTTYSYLYSVIGAGINGNKSGVTTAFDTVEILLNY